MLTVVVNCGLCEEFIGRCIESLRMQTYTDWQAFVTADRRGDRTYECAVEARGGDERIVVTRNRRRLYPMENIVRALRRANPDPEDVVVILDGDDWLLGERSLEIIAAQYEDDDCWMTYGSWISNKETHPGRWPAYPDGADFRSAPWLGTAMRTWKKWLFDLVDGDDLRDRAGRWFRVSEDVACMLPMLEMATTRHARHIAEPLMLYNRLSHHDPKRRLKNEGLRNVDDLRARRRYAPLDAKSVRIQSDHKAAQHGVYTSGTPA